MAKTRLIGDYPVIGIARVDKEYVISTIFFYF